MEELAAPPAALEGASSPLDAALGLLGFGNLDWASTKLREFCQRQLPPVDVDSEAAPWLIQRLAHPGRWDEKRAGKQQQQQVELARLLAELAVRYPAVAGALLLVAVREGLVGLAELLVRSGAPTECRSSMGWTPLMASISEWPTKDATRFASLMHARGCDLNAVNEWGNSAVSLALYYGKMELASQLLDWGAAVAQPANFGLMPPGPHVGHEEPEPWLHALCWRAGEQPAFTRWDALVDQLVAAGASVAEVDAAGVPVLVALADAMAWRGFRVAAHFALLEVLLEHGASATAAAPDGHTPLHALVGEQESCVLPDVEGFHRAVTRLVEAGCGTNAYSITERMTALGLLSKYVVPLPGLGLAPDSMADREVDLVGLARVLLEAGSDPTLPIQGPVDEGRLQGLSELDRLTVLSSPMVTVLFGAYGQIQAGGPAAWRAVEYVRLLAEWEFQRAGGSGAARGLVATVMWFNELGKGVMERLNRPLSELELEMSQVILRWCCPRLWPETLLFKLDSVAMVVAAAGSLELLQALLAAVDFGQLSALRGGPPGMCLVSLMCGSAMPKLLHVPQPDAQVGLTAEHAHNPLVAWRQARVLFEHGAQRADLDACLDRHPPWSHELLRFIVACAHGSWRPDATSEFPTAFQAAARMVVLINSCRGFDSGGDAGSGGGGRRGGVKLPSELLEQILGLAAEPIIWVPELHPFLSEEERQQWLQAEPGAARQEGRPLDAVPEAA